MSTRINETALCTFLYEVNENGYSTGNEKKWKKNLDSSTSITYENGDWKSDDTFFGGEPYGGRLVVFYLDKPVWIMVYYGWVKTKSDINTVYGLLRNALRNMPKDMPLRGPKRYSSDEGEYVNRWSGSISRYEGNEKIVIKSKIIYETFYRGGLVDQMSGI